MQYLLDTNACIAAMKNHLGTISEIGFDTQAAKEAAVIRARLEALGQMIGPYDVLLAGQAKAAGLRLVTHNTAEFARVSGLAIEDWQT